jgi:thymidylate synthase
MESENQVSRASVHVDKIYLDLIRDVLANGELRPNRTGTDTIAVFGRQMRFDLRKGFPLLTTKKVHTRSVFQELLWFLRGDNVVANLQKVGVTIWDEWQTAEGTIGRGYGKQWVDWHSTDYSGVAEGQPPIGYVVVDQLKLLIDGLRNNPFGRRHIVTAWNPGELPHMALPPCHMMFQCHVHPVHPLQEEGSKMGLSLQLYQRSCDLGLGVPMNIASYAALTHMIAQCAGMEVRDFIHDLGDAHIYVNHIDALRGQLTRRISPMPRLELNPKRTELDQFTYNDVKVTGYTPEPPIPMEVAV